MGTPTRHFEKVLREVSTAGGLTYEARRLADKILHAKSHSSEKLEGTKYFVEPLKLKLLEIYDPRYRPEQFRMNTASVFAADYIFTSAGGNERGVDYKLLTATFSDPLWNIQPSDYCCMAKPQFDRYRETPTTIFLERQITNFDPAFLCGRKNIDAFRYAKMLEQETWHYAQITPKELQGWKKGKDYFVSITNGVDPDVIVVFRLSNLKRVWNLTQELKVAKKKKVLI